jgi:RNA-binding protein Musashi
MLTNEFAKYGDIVDSIVVKNQETGASRGFGFVTFKDNATAQRAVNSGTHKIDSKVVDVKLCDPSSTAKGKTAAAAAATATNKHRNENCKVFVGGLPHGVTEDEIKQFFTRYGPVKDFKMKYDEAKQRPRGFGFITFESEETANQVLNERYILFNEKQIEVKPQKHNNIANNVNNIASVVAKQQQHQQHSLLNSISSHQHQQQQQLVQQQQQQQAVTANFGLWNQPWNHPNPNSQAAAAAANTSSATGWGASSYGQLGGLGQPWAFANPAPQPQPQNQQLHHHAATSAAAAVQSNHQSNWNYNYYGI